MAKSKTPDLRIFYVYIVFCLNGWPVYVGKGHGTRWRVRDRKYNRQLHGMLRKAGGKLPIVVIREDMTESEAFELEHLLIKAIGRADRGEGPLVNHTDGGEGEAGQYKSDEERQRVREWSRARWADPEVRAALIAAQNEGRATEEYRQKRREISAKVWEDDSRREQASKTKLAMYQEDPSYAERISSETKKAMARVEVKKNTSEAQLKRFQDPVERAKQGRTLGRKLSESQRMNIAAGLKGHVVSNETKEKIRIKNIGRKLSDETKAAMRDAANRRWAKPEERERVSKTLTGRKLSEEHRSHMSEGTRQSWANRRLPK